MSYVQTFAFAILGYFLIGGLFFVRRKFPETSRNLSRETPFTSQAEEARSEVKEAETYAESRLFAVSGVEYEFEAPVGLMRIVPREGLPTAVELRLGGQVIGTYLSAEFAAEAVANAATLHAGLNALPLSRRPGKLNDWRQSLPSCLAV